MLSLSLTQTKEYELYFLRLYKPKNKNSRGQGTFLVSSVLPVATSNIKQAGSQQGTGNETRGASD